MTRHKAISTLAIFLSTAFISAMCIVLFQQLTGNQSWNANAPQPQVENPDFSLGGGTDEWSHDSFPLDTLSDTAPLRIKIPELGVDSKVVPVGINPDQSMEIPSNIFNIGWYEPGPSPGDPIGSAVLAGHRDGAEAGRGAFYNLGELDRGDVIKLSTKTKKMKFSVMRTEILDKDSFALRSQEIFASDGPGVLTLITCGGDYDRSRGGYQANVIVTAKMSG
jgi:LPXTG-site transpeptidase (sortase) family protein